MNRILAVIGMCGSGKSEAVKFLMEKGFSRVYFGDVVMNELIAKKLEINEVNERMMRENLRKEFGMGVMALKSLDAIRKLYNKGNIVIESLYSWEEFKIVKNEFRESFELLNIFTTKELRYKRLNARPYRPLTNNEAESRDISEIEKLDKGGPIAFADYTIFNDTTLDDLKSEIDKLF